MRHAITCTYEVLRVLSQNPFAKNLLPPKKKQKSQVPSQKKKCDSENERTNGYLLLHRGYRDSARLQGESRCQKIERPFGGKISQKSRNSCTMNGRGCECIGTADSRRNFAQSWTKYKRSKNVFAVTSIALSCKHIWAQLLQPLAQSPSEKYTRYTVVCQFHKLL